MGPFFPTGFTLTVTVVEIGFIVFEDHPIVCINKDPSYSVDILDYPPHFL